MDVKMLWGVVGRNGKTDTNVRASCNNHPACYAFVFSSSTWPGVILLVGSVSKNLIPGNLLPGIEMFRWFLFYLEEGP